MSVSVLLSFILLVIIVACLAWAFNNYVIGNLPMDGGFKQLIIAFVYFIAIVIIALQGLPLVGIAI